MYLAYYGLQREPFHTTPDPSFLFLSPSHKEALGAIIYGVEKRKGFIAIIGEVGSGKTSILRAYLERKAPQKQKTIYIFNPALSFHELLIAIFRGLELVPRHDDVTEMVNQLHEALVTEYQAGGTVVLAIDEAQNMPVETLENLRMLSNLETSTDKLIQIILLGQPELDSLLKQPALRQFQQRIALWATICPLTEEESRAYIEHRIARATTTGTPLLYNKNEVTPSLFTKGALNLIVRQAKGIPRRLNVLCDNALITGFGRQCKPVSVSVAKEIIRDFGADEVSSLSSHLKWAVGIAVAIIFFLGMISFFGAPSQYRKIIEMYAIEMYAMVNQADDQTSGMSTNSKAESSAGVGQLTQSQNGGSSAEKRPIPDMARDDTRRGHQREQSKTVSGIQPSVGFPGVATAESSLSEPPVSFPKQGISESEYDGTGTSVVQEAESSVQPGEAIDRQSVKSADKVHEGRSVLAKRATRSMSGENSTVLRAVKEGENLSLIAIETYGSKNVKYLKWVKQHNPQIVNPDFILPGQYVVLPKYRKNEASR
jgi:general secretion pathway protein A